MRLINVGTMELEEFFDQRIPPYAILSHRWGKEEVTLQDYAQFGSRWWKWAGHKKIEGFCKLARSEGHRYAWIDTCCIDKTSSAELSEAINSMFDWYKNSEICYAYLSDVTPETTCDSDQYDRLFRQSDWFTRGWTLQELLAPRTLVFYDKNWQRIGSCYGKAHDVKKITGIRRTYLKGPRDRVTKAPVAERLSWASQRKTTRIEDMACCLIGLLDVNLPLIYGEGHKAFRRLQEEFMKTHLDLTLLTWGLMKSPQVYMATPVTFSENVSCLATTISQFQKWNGQAITLHDPKGHHAITNAGLLMAFGVREVAKTPSIRRGFMVLDNFEFVDVSINSRLAIPLVWEDPAGGTTKAQRANGNGPFPVPEFETDRAIEGQTYLVSQRPSHDSQPSKRILNNSEPWKQIPNDVIFLSSSDTPLDFFHLRGLGYAIADFYPPNALKSPTIWNFCYTYEIETEEPVFVRFTHPKRRDILLLYESQIDARFPLSLGTAPETCTTWEHLLKPKYDRISFQRPRETYLWFSKVRKLDLSRNHRIVVDVQKGLTATNPS